MDFGYMRYAYRWWYNFVRLFLLVLLASILWASFILIQRLESLNIVHLEQFKVILHSRKSLLD